MQVGNTVYKLQCVTTLHRPVELIYIFSLDLYIQSQSDLFLQFPPLYSFLTIDDTYTI